MVHRHSITHDSGALLEFHVGVEIITNTVLVPYYKYSIVGPKTLF